VRALTRTPTGWRLTAGSAAAPTCYDADAVVLAVPAAPAARLLAPITPTAAAGLAAVEYASVAIVTLVLDGPLAGARGSGYLVPAVEGRTTKAVTFSSRKWPHLAGAHSSCGPASAGPPRPADLQRSDDELVEVVLAELAQTVGPLPRLVDSRVVRWGGGLPQYAVGHLDLVRRVREGVAGSAGSRCRSAYDGVGVPACAKSGRRQRRPCSGRMACMTVDRPEATKARELNDQLLYTMYAVFTAETPLPEDRTSLAEDAQQFLDAALQKDVYTRGTYDLAGFKAEAELLVWWTCPEVDVLQDTYNRFRQSALGRHLAPVWSSVGIHRPAEFNRNHIPAYVRREDPRKYVCVYPFNRSLEWYLLPDYERKGMLSEHGIQGREYEDVRPTPSPPSGSATTSGCWPSRPTRCTGSPTACATCAPRGPGCTPSSRRRSGPASASRWPTSWPACRSRSAVRAAPADRYADSSLRTCSICETCSAGRGPCAMAAALPSAWATVRIPGSGP
jgi:chlorite dismutase